MDKTSLDLILKWCIHNQELVNGKKKMNIIQIKKIGVVFPIFKKIPRFHFRKPFNSLYE